MLIYRRGACPLHSRWIPLCPGITFLAPGGRRLIYRFCSSRLDTREADHAGKGAGGVAGELRSIICQDHLVPDGDWLGLSGGPSWLCQGLGRRMLALSPLAPPNLVSDSCLVNNLRGSCQLTCLCSSCPLLRLHRVRHGGPPWNQYPPWRNRGSEISGDLFHSSAGCGV